MFSNDWLWPFGLLMLFAAGVISVLPSRLRAADLRRRTAWSSARAAIEAAGISRDAARADVPEAEQLLARAESVAAGRGGSVAADAATAYAERAEKLWRDA